MPVLYERTETAAAVRIRCSGEVTILDVIAGCKLHLEEERIPAPLNIFLDLREMISVPTTPEIRAVSDTLFHLRRKPAFGSCAVLTERDATFGMARMFSILVEEMFVAVRVFRLPAEANEWFEARCAKRDASISGTGTVATPPTGT